MNRVKQLREEKNIRQIDLAQKLKISQGTLSNWEREVHDPDNKSLMVLARFFDCSVDYLLCNSDIRKPSKNIENEDNVYYRLMQDAQNANIDPQDIRLAINFIQKAKLRDEKINKK